MCPIHPSLRACIHVGDLETPFLSSASLLLLGLQSQLDETSPPSCSPPPEVMGPYFEQLPCFPTLSSDTSDFFLHSLNLLLQQPWWVTLHHPEPGVRPRPQGALTYMESEFLKRENTRQSELNLSKAATVIFSLIIRTQITSPGFSPKHTD